MSSNEQRGGTPYLLVPRGRQGLAPLNFDMTEIYRIEARISEIRSANPETMPDLVTDFNIGYLQIGRIISALQLEHAEAKMAYQEAKSIVLLDKAEGILKDKGLKSSTDSREAVVTLDQDVKEAQNRMHAIDACLTLLYNKLTAMEWAYNSAKKIGDIQSRAPSTPLRGGYER